MFSIANVGPDQTVLVNSTVPLDIRGSSDRDGDKLTCSWRFISKPRSSTARLSHSKIQNCINPFFLKFTFKLHKTRDYVLELRVNDERGARYRRVKITARAHIISLTFITKFQVSDNEDGRPTLTCLDQLFNNDLANSSFAARPAATQPAIMRASWFTNLFIPLVMDQEWLRNYWSSTHWSHCGSRSYFTMRKFEILEQKANLKIRAFGKAK
jgi:hypothetical protein